LTYSGFQQGPLNETRVSTLPIFIGTSRGGCFLIETPEHAEVVRNFYDAKISAMEANRKHLLKQADRVNWQHLRISA
jgi:hypothetical protein